MRKQHLLILSILIFSSMIRLYNIAEIPLGISLIEAKFGLFLSPIGGWVFDPFIIRLPFAIIGIFSIYLFYKLSSKIFKDETLALISTLLLGIMPWHFQNSRILSLGMVLFFFLVSITNIYFEKIFANINKFFKYSILISLLLFFVSIVIPSKNSTIMVNSQRATVTNSVPVLVSKVFINKYFENYKFRSKILFENLDFGNLFFNGHPRERWGIEDIQKMFLFMLPLITLGLFKIEPNKRKFIFSWWVICLSFLNIFEFRQSETLILIVPYILLCVAGIQWLLNKNTRVTKIFLAATILFGIYELIVFGTLYYSGLGGSLFSPRRSVFKELTEKITLVQKSNDKIVVNTKLIDPKPFFDFYLKKQTNNYEFRNYVFWQEQKDNRLFVDVLPDDPSPSEPLFKPNGKWPEIIEVYGEYYDKGKRQTVVIFRIK